MKSPFPGMDPYIEACGLWGDFHNRLINQIADALDRAVPESYIVRTGERSYIVMVEQEGKEKVHFEPDVNVTGPPRLVPSSSGTSALAVAEPATDSESVLLRSFVAVEFREQFVEIFYGDGDDRVLVTCIEVLSPSNKRPNSEGREVYLRKRQGLLLGQANLVELDLLRGGQRMPMLDPWPASPYVLLVSNRSRTPYCRVWKGYSLRPLPAISVPLGASDPPIPLDLQPMIDAIYLRSRYSRDIDYTRPIAPPLAEDEVAWLQQGVRP